jgi:hypothetical protein
MADRETEVRDHALDAVDEAIDKFREDLKATKSVRQRDGSIVEMPAGYMKPDDLCLLLDRFEVLFGRPSSISSTRASASPPSCRSTLCGSSSRRHGE